MAHTSCETQNASWGAWLRARREEIRLSQEAFARLVSDMCTPGYEEYAALVRELTYLRTVSLAGFEVSRFEKGIRVPAHRSTHLVLIWVLMRMGCVISADNANSWLELGNQGWLTAREKACLYECNHHKNDANGMIAGTPEAPPNLLET